MRMPTVGDVDRVGWWTLPAFLAVGLAGAVMAGSLAVVYYSQQVKRLTSETAASRAELASAAEDVGRARDDAIAALQSEVEAARDVLSREQPVEDVATLGVVVISALVNSPPPPAPPAPPAPPPSGTETPAGAPDPHAPDRSAPNSPAPTLLAQEQPTEAEPTGQPTEPAPPPTQPVRPRLGVGFAVAVEGADVFFATSFDLVADPDARAGVVEAVEVTTMAGATVPGVVHSWDENRGLALVRATTGELPVPKWRPRTENLNPGDRITVAGLVPDRRPVQVDGAVALADLTSVVASLAAPEFLRGAPVVDRTGRVVAVFTPGYRPFGAAAGDGQALAPVGLLCESMIRGCEELELPADQVPTPTED
jgi:hypothetical protein